MSNVELIGSTGVAILLAAYFLQLVKWLKSESRLYLFLNTAGGLIAAYASLLLHFMPFVILEGSWGLISLFTLIKSYFPKNQSRNL